MQRGLLNPETVEWGCKICGPIIVLIISFSRGTYPYPAFMGRWEIVQEM